jgi:hypothetical protein
MRKLAWTTFAILPLVAVLVGCGGSDSHTAVQSSGVTGKQKLTGEKGGERKGVLTDDIPAPK